MLVAPIISRRFQRAGNFVATPIRHGSCLQTVSFVDMPPSTLVASGESQERPVDTVYASEFVRMYKLVSYHLAATSTAGGAFHVFAHVLRCRVDLRL